MFLRAFAVILLCLGTVAHADKRTEVLPKEVQERMKKDRRFEEKVNRVLDLARGTGKVELKTEDIEALKEMRDEMKKAGKEGEMVTLYGQIRTRATANGLAARRLNETGFATYDKQLGAAKPSDLVRLEVVQKRTGDMNTGFVSTDNGGSKAPKSRADVLKVEAPLLTRFENTAENFTTDRGGKPDDQKAKRGRINKAVADAEATDAKLDPNKPSDAQQAVIQEQVRRQRRLKAMERNDEKAPGGLDEILQKDKDGRFPPAAENALKGVEYITELIDGGLVRGLVETPAEMRSRAAKLKQEIEARRKEGKTPENLLKSLEAQAESLRRVAEVAEKTRVTIDGKQMTLAQALESVPEAKGKVDRLKALQKEIDAFSEKRRKATTPEEQLALEQEISARMLERQVVLEELYNLPEILKNPKLKPLVEALDKYRENAQMELARALEGRLAEVLANDPRFRDKSPLERRAEAKEIICTKCKDGLPPMGAYCRATPASTSGTPSKGTH